MSKNNMKNALLYLATPNYYTYCQVSIYSFLENNKWFIEKDNDIIIVIYEPIDNFNKKNFSKLYKNIKFIYLDENNIYKKLQDFYCSKCKVNNNYRRLFEKFILFDIKDYEKILYIDVDIIINKSLEYIFNTNNLLLTNILPNQENYFNFFQIHKKHIKNNVMYEFEKKNISYSDYFKYYNFDTLGTCAGFILYNNNFKTDIFSFENMKNFIIKNCNEKTNLPSNTIEETFLNYYINNIRINNLPQKLSTEERNKILDNIILLNGSNCGFIAADNWGFCFKQNIFDKKDEIIDELLKYDILHYFNKPWLNVDIFEAPYKIWYYYLNKTLLKINS